MDPPDWVLAYMDGFAATLCTWVDGTPPSRDLARDVGTALGFAPGKKGENPLIDWRSRRQGERWFGAFEALLDQGLSPSAAIHRVAEGHNSSEPTVRRRLEGFAATFDLTAKELAGERRRLWEKVEEESRRAEERSRARLAAALEGRPFPDDDGEGEADG